MSEKVKDAVVAEAKTTRALAQEIVMSGAYLYPFKASSHHFPRPFAHLPILTRRMSITGHLLFCDPQGPMAPVSRPCWADNHTGSGGNKRDVLLHLCAADGHHGFHQRPASRYLRSDLGT